MNPSAWKLCYIYSFYSTTVIFAFLVFYEQLPLIENVYKGHPLLPRRHDNLVFAEKNDRKKWDWNKLNKAWFLKF